MDFPFKDYHHVFQCCDIILPLMDGNYPGFHILEIPAPMFPFMMTEKMIGNEKKETKPTPNQTKGETQSKKEKPDRRLMKESPEGGKVPATIYLKPSLLAHFLYQPPEFFPSPHQQSSQSSVKSQENPKHQSGKTESSRTTLHQSRRCHRGGDCCLLPGCSGCDVCRRVKRLHRHRADRWTGSRCLPAADLASLGGSPGRKVYPTPRDLCTWRTHLEEMHMDVIIIKKVWPTLLMVELCQSTFKNCFPMVAMSALYEGDWSCKLGFFLTCSSFPWACLTKILPEHTRFKLLLFFL